MECQGLVKKHDYSLALKELQDMLDKETGDGNGERVISEEEVIVLHANITYNL